MTRVARFHTLAGPDALRVETESVLPPGHGEVAVDVTAIGLNRAEAMFMRGTYLVQPSLPSRVGVEAAGRVTAVGRGVESVDVGARVAVFCAPNMVDYGVAAERIVVPEAMLLPDLPGVDDEALAAVWMAYLTAWGGLVATGKLVQGETALLTAASSSVGLAAIEVCRRLGARAIATTRTEVKRQRLEAAGAARVVATTQEPWPELGEAVDLVFDAIAGSGVEALARALARRGRIVVYGLLSGEPSTPFPLFAALDNPFVMTAFHLGAHLMGEPALREQAFRWIQESHRAVPLPIVIDQVFELEAIADAYRHLEGSTQVGKVVVRVDR